MKEVLLCWIGQKDISAAKGIEQEWSGHVLHALRWVGVTPEERFDSALLLAAYPEEECNNYIGWIKNQVPSVQIEHRRMQDGFDPTSFKDVFRAAENAIRDTQKKYGPNTRISLEISSGTSAMTSCWVLLGKAYFPDARLMASSKYFDVREVTIPFDITAAYKQDAIRRLLSSPAQRPDAPGFDDIITTSPAVYRAMNKAALVAKTDVNVLLQGESGTGKELFARAIWKSSNRADRTFVAANCAGIPEQLSESLLFGHVRGAFTGADRPHDGYFEQADGGTLFLDEVGELPMGIQAKLLRAIQDRTIRKLGSAIDESVDVRLICATNRELLKEAAEGRFREDLFYRVCQILISLPPLRNRKGDITRLAELFIKKIELNEKKLPKKSLSLDAERVLLEHTWPGNVRELENAVVHAWLFSEKAEISGEDVRESLLIPSIKGDILGRPIGEGFSIESVVGEVARHYLERAREKSRGTKLGAARLLGLDNGHNLDTWCRKAGIDWK